MVVCCQILNFDLFHVVSQLHISCKWNGFTFSSTVLSSPLQSHLHEKILAQFWGFYNRNMCCLISIHFIIKFNYSINISNPILHTWLQKKQNHHFIYLNNQFIVFNVRKAFFTTVSICYREFCESNFSIYIMCVVDFFNLLKCVLFFCMNAVINTTHTK